MNLTQWGMEFGCATSNVHYRDKLDEFREVFVNLGNLESFRDFYTCGFTDGNESYINMGW